MKLCVALVGCGRWGSRLLAALVRHPAIEVAAVVDVDRRALARAAHVAPRARLSPGLEPLRDIDAAIIATPAMMHYANAREALARGLDVLVEKPLATQAADARALAAMAHDRVAMVGHVLRYHPAVERLVAMSRAGAAGDLHHARFRRFTSSGTRHPLWALAPHDVATLYAIDDAALRSLHATRRGDVIELSVTLASGLVADLQVSTTAAEPMRRTHISGNRGALHLDELAMTAHDALRRELDHFVHCVRHRETPRTSFDESVRIVETLALAERQLEEAGREPLAAAR